jgi:hypothetical protein
MNSTEVSSKTINVTLQKALDLHMSGDIEAARIALNISSIPEGSENCHSILAMQSLLSGDLNKAIFLFFMELQDHPSNSVAQEALWRLCVSLGIRQLVCYFDACQYLSLIQSRVIASDNSIRAKIIRYICQVFGNVNLSELSKLIDSIPPNDPPMRDFYHLFGLILLAQERNSEAHMLFWEEIRYFPDSLCSRDALKRISSEKLILDHLTKNRSESLNDTCLGAPVHQAIVEFSIPGKYYFNFQRPVNIDNHSNALKEFLPSNCEKREYQKSYVVIYPGVNWIEEQNSFYKNGRALLWNLFKQLSNSSDIETTMVSYAGREGVQGTEYALGTIRVNRKPDLIIITRPWWGEEHVTALDARSQGIPVIAVEHGVFFMEQPTFKYRQHIYPADISCVWNKIDHDIMRDFYGATYPIAITGSPEYDSLISPPERLPNLPDKYALFLTGGNGYQADELFETALNLKKHIAVVAKAHPLERSPERLEQNFLTFRDPETLFSLIYHSSIVYGHLSSALIPAVHWRKPIFIRALPCADYDLDKIKRQFDGQFHFLDTNDWDPEILHSARPVPDDKIEKICSKIDGNISSRMVDLVRKFLVKVR